MRQPAPDTIDTVPDKTLEAFADHGNVGAPMSVDGGDAEAMLMEFKRAGIDIDALAQQLQVEGAEAIVKSWPALLASVDGKRETG